MTAEVYANLHHALDANRKLQFLELMMPADWENRNGRHNPEHGVAMVERNRIEQAAHREPLCLGLPLNQRAAFLSVIQYASAIGSTRQGLDSFMVSSIFKFAGKQIWRRILWNQELGPDTPPEDY